MHRDLDYQRFGRQIALPELGAEGQHRLATTPVTFGPASVVATLAAALHTRAGGNVHPPADVTIQLPDRVSTRWNTLGLAAWGAVEAGRRVLGHAPAALPVALLERLGV